MKKERWFLLVLVWLGTTLPVGANVPFHVAEDHPQYLRSKTAASVYWIAVLAAVVTSCWWLSRSRSLLGKVAAGLFLVLVVACTGLFSLGIPPTVFEPPGRPSVRGFTPLPNDGSIWTPEESILAGIMLSLLVTGGGLVAVRGLGVIWGRLRGRTLADKQSPDAS